MQDSYVLETAEHERVYANIIEPAFFLGTSSVENPRVVFVGGQPGAGKTKLFKQTPQILSWLTLPNPSLNITSQPLET